MVTGTISVTLVWLILMIVFAGIEAATMGLTTIWFAAGSLGALICSLAGLPLWVQIAVFLAVSIIMLVFTRRIFVEKLKIGGTRTNVDSLIGETGIVLTTVTSFNGGRVKILGQEWAARVKTENLSLQEGTVVQVLNVEGVTLIVAPKN